MQTKAKSNSVVTHEAAGDADGYTSITFRVNGCEPLVLDLSRLSDAVAQRAFLHGMVQRVSDAAAISRNPDTGKPATHEEKRARMARLVEHYMTGSADWSPSRGETGPRDEGLTITAMGDFYHKLAEECREMVKAFAAKRGVTERVALGEFAKSKQIAARIAELKAQRASGGPDADELLNELNSEVAE